MKKVLILSMICLSALTFGKSQNLKNGLGLAIKPDITNSSSFRKDPSPQSSENISSNIEKYFSKMDYAGKTWASVFIEDVNVFKELRKKIPAYKDTAILFLPQGKRIMCLPKPSIMTSEVYLNGDIQIPTTERNGNICTKSAVDRILVFSSNVDTKQISKVNIEFKGKVFLNEKKVKELFK